MTERNCRQHKAAVPLEGGGFACSGQFHASVWLNDTQHTGERIHRHCLMISQQVYYVGPLGHVQHDFESIRATVDYIPQDIESIIGAKVDFV